MTMATEYATQEPTRAEIDALNGPVLLEFGTGWCGYCRALKPDLADALAKHPHVRHIKVEDGPGRPLGRSFGVKLWPALVFLKDGQVIQQMSRPGPEDVRAALAEIDTGG